MVSNHLQNTVEEAHVTVNDWRKMLIRHRWYKYVHQITIHQKRSIPASFLYPGHTSR